MGGDSGSWPYEPIVSAWMCQVYVETCWITALGGHVSIWVWEEVEGWERRGSWGISKVWFGRGEAVNYSSAFESYFLVSCR